MKCATKDYFLCPYDSFFMASNKRNSKNKKREKEKKEFLMKKKFIDFAC